MHDDTSDIQEPERHGPSRRTVLKAAAWSVPAIVVAQAAASPAMALVDTPSNPIIIDFSNSTACKIPGNSWGSLCYNKGYVLWALFKNTLAYDATVQVTGIVVGGIPQCLIGTSLPTAAVGSCSTLVSSITVPAASGNTPGQVIVGIFSNASTDSSSTLVQVAFNYTVQSITKSAVTSGNVIGGSWTTGVGSCSFPAGDCSLKKPDPPSACGASGPNC